MKTFSFSLQAVKRLRADAEQRAQLELGRRIAAHGAAERARDARRQGLELARRQRAATAAPAHELARADQEHDAALLRLGAADAEAVAAGREVDARRVDLAGASRALEVLERLEERRRSAHRAAALAEDEAAVQEIVESRAARRAAGERRGR
jgi:flagellar export protein FliJ